MPMLSTVGLECRLAVVGCTSTIYDLSRVLEVVVDQCCRLEDVFLSLFPLNPACCEGLLLKTRLL